MEIHMPEPIDIANLYDSYYYKHCCGKNYERTAEWLDFFANIAQQIISQISPKTALDAGCAWGFLVEALRDRGVDAFGLDVSSYAIQMVREDVKPYCQLGSILEPLPFKYDLIVCIEVLEHLQPAQCDRAIANLCQASDDILFSSTPDDHREFTHFNVQPTEYWAELFALNGFFRDVDFEASFITPWAIRFKKNKNPVHRIIREYERKFWTLWKSNLEIRNFNSEIKNTLNFQENKILELESYLSKIKEDYLRVPKKLNSLIKRLLNFF
jgi:hypothetical protein